MKSFVGTIRSWIRPEVLIAVYGIVGMICIVSMCLASDDHNQAPADTTMKRTDLIVQVKRTIQMKQQSILDLQDEIKVLQGQLSVLEQLADSTVKVKK